MSEFADIYYDPKHPSSFSGARNLQKLFKGKKKKEQALEWLRAQDVFTLHKPTRRKFSRRHYRLGTIFELFEADLADVHQTKDVNDETTFLLFVIDAVSKFLWVQPLKNKKPESIVEAFKKILKQCAPHKPFSLQTDAGSEFTGSVFQKFLKSEEIRFRVARSPTIKSSHAERVIRTIKERFQRYLEYKNTKKYIDVLQDIVSAYNNRVHSITKLKPASVTYENVHVAVSNIRKRYKDPPAKRPKYKIGDLVRISRARETFEKKYLSAFTEEIFQVSRVDTFQTPHIYELKDLNNEPILGSFYELELSKVSKSRKDGEYIVEKVLKRRGKGKNAEVYVKWAGYTDKFNSWIPAASVRDLSS